MIRPRMKTLRTKRTRVFNSRKLNVAARGGEAAEVTMKTTMKNQGNKKANIFERNTQILFYHFALCILFL
jgi:hypothetical protein